MQQDKKAPWHHSSLSQLIQSPSRNRWERFYLENEKMVTVGHQALHLLLQARSQVAFDHPEQFRWPTLCRNNGSNCFFAATITTEYALK